MLKKARADDFELYFFVKAHFYNMYKKIKKFKAKNIVTSDRHTF